MTRDQFLCEKMGIEYRPSHLFGWEFFGLLWTWAKKQEWWAGFVDNNGILDHAGKVPAFFDIDLVYPSYFADAVAKYLGYKEGR